MGQDYRSRKIITVVLASLIVLALAAVLVTSLVKSGGGRKQLEAQVEEVKAASKQLEEEAEKLKQENLALQDALETMEESQEENDSYVVELKERLEAYEAGKKPKEVREKSYQKKYENLYAYDKLSGKTEEKTVYLTFDDGPSDRTSEILDILDQYEIKATFFTVYKAASKYQDVYKEILDRGHTLAIHTYTHEYRQIYSSVSAYLKDYNKMYEFLLEKTGQRTRIFRFPGGSKNAYNKAYYKDIIDEMERRGFIYFDWNVDSGDAVGGATVKSIKKNTLDGVKARSGVSIVLMHDANGKVYTVEALPDIIEELLNDGYTFKPITEDTREVQFKK